MTIIEDEARAELPVSQARSHPIARISRGEESRASQAMVVDLTIPRRWDGRLAYVISKVGSPPVLAPAAIALTASTLSDPGAWTWAGLYVLLAVLAPFLYLAWLVRRGRVTDLDVQLREQRAQPLLVTMICMGLGWLLLVLGPAPSPLIVLAGSSWVQALFIFAVTLRWKISMHVATAAGAMTVAWALLETPLPLLIGVPLMAWSRVRLRRHTLPQTIAGALLGFVIFLTATPLMTMSQR